MVLGEGNYVLDVFNKLWLRGAFPKIWRTGKLVLIKKPRKDKSSAQTYRPICLLSELGKLYERLINARLQEDMERRGGLSDFQFGFRRGKSTVEAVDRVQQIAKLANSGALQRRDFCLLITVDVKNTFNSAPWKKIIATMMK